MRRFDSKLETIKKNGELQRTIKGFLFARGEEV